MRRRTVTVVLAVVVSVAFAAAVVASTLSGGDTSGAHTMQDGTTMSDDQMTP
jgi:hypothetical protein